MEEVLEALADARVLIGVAVLAGSCIMLLDHPSAANLRKAIAAAISL
jgi:hypothetical protein